MFDEETEPQDEFLEEDEELEPVSAIAPPAPKTNTQQEVAYLRSLIERNAPVSVKIRNGEVFHGVIEYYDQRFIRLTREGQPNLFIFKRDILYLSEA
jgi:host factor-I protein